MTVCKKKILDATCGARTMWFDKQNPHTVFFDKRCEHYDGLWKNSPGSTLDIVPDVVGDFTHIPYPNCNMGSVRVHYYVDDVEAWQNLDESEVGWHAADGNYGPGNSTTIAIEIIMDGTDAEYNRIAEDNGARLCAAILKRHGLDETAVYQHHDWYARKDCPVYIRPHWSAFLAAVRQYLSDDTQVPSDYDKLVAELADLKEQLQLQHANAQDFRNEILAAVAKYDMK